jgi:KDO2-lipid IV(A) lauroyltransferase
VIRNLKNSFPQWDERKIRTTARKFYHYFIDQLFETFAAIYMSDRELRSRFTLRNPEIINHYYSSSQSLTLLMSHYGNWEWATICQAYLKHQAIVIYKPLRNKFIDTYLKKIRERYGFHTVAMEKIVRELHHYIENNVPTVTFYIADQRPLRAHIQYWLTFLNQDTPVILGPEKISVKYDLPVFYVNIIRPRRGFYEGEFIKLFEHGKQTKPYEITQKYYEILEKIIREKPEYWLWSHKRWKHKRPIDETSDKHTPGE